jgi:hypothetical protein
MSLYSNEPKDVSLNVNKFKVSMARDTTLVGRERLNLPTLVQFVFRASALPGLGAIERDPLRI